MRIAVLSDVHANLHALEAVLAEIDAGGFDGIWFLGDLVGYGPKPNECAALLQERGCDLPGRQPRPGRAREDPDRRVRGRRRGRGTLDADGPRRERAGIPRLAPAAGERAGSRALPRQPARSGLGLRARGRELLASALATTRGRSCSSATATSRSRSRTASDLRGEPAPAGTRLELGRLRRLLNPGSVGQPRDGDPRAAWLEIDFETAWATFRRTDYPVEQTQARDATSWVSPRLWRRDSRTASSPTPTRTEQHGGTDEPGDQARRGDRPRDGRAGSDRAGGEADQGRERCASS